MQKRIIGQEADTQSVPAPRWLNLERLAQVEVSSEDAAHPIEAALLENAGPGWRAGEAGRQTLRLIFDEPQRVRHIRLRFQDNEQQRTQEFVLRWSADGGRSYRDILRQQYNFNPDRSTIELEEYDVKLDNLTALELTIVPDISGAPVRASLAELRLL